MFVSFSRLATDLGETIVRRDGVEAYVVTSLFIFWTPEVSSHLHESDSPVVRTLLMTILRNVVLQSPAMSYIHVDKELCVCYRTLDEETEIAEAKRRMQLMYDSGTPLFTKKTLKDLSRQPKQSDKGYA